MDWTPEQQEEIRKLRLISQFTLRDIRDTLRGRASTQIDIEKVYGCLEKFNASIPDDWNNGEVITFALALLEAQMLMMWDHMEKL